MKLPDLPLAGVTEADTERAKRFVNQHLGMGGSQIFVLAVAELTARERQVRELLAKIEKLDGQK